MVGTRDGCDDFSLGIPSSIHPNLSAIKCQALHGWRIKLGLKCHPYSQGPSNLVGEEQGQGGQIYRNLKFIVKCYARVLTENKDFATQH